MTSLVASLLIHCIHENGLLWVVLVINLVNFEAHPVGRMAHFTCLVAGTSSGF